MPVGMGDRQRRLAAQGGFGGGLVELGQRAISPGQGFLHIGIRIPHQLRQQPECAARQPRITSGPSPAVGHRRNRRADQAALPARRAVDELLQLGPAVGFCGDPDPVRMRQRIDGDPVAGLAGGSSHQLPGSFGLVTEGPLQKAKREPAVLQLGFPKEPIGQEEERRRARPLDGDTEAALDSRQQRPANTEQRPDAGRDPALAVEVVRIGESLQAVPQGDREGVWLIDQLGERRSERLGRRSTVGDEGHGTRSDRARRGRRHHGFASDEPFGPLLPFVVVAPAPTRRNPYRSCSSRFRAVSAATYTPVAVASVMPVETSTT